MALADVLESTPLVGGTFGLVRDAFNRRDLPSMLVGGALLGSELALPFGLAKVGRKLASPTARAALVRDIQPERGAMQWGKPGWERNRSIVNTAVAPPHNWDWERATAYSNLKQKGYHNLDTKEFRQFGTLAQGDDASIRDVLRAIRGQQTGAVRPGSFVPGSNVPVRAVGKYRPGAAGVPAVLKPPETAEVLRRLQGYPIDPRFGVNVSPRGGQMRAAMDVDDWRQALDALEGPVGADTGSPLINERVRQLREWGEPQFADVLESYQFGRDLPVDRALRAAHDVTSGNFSPLRAAAGDPFKMRQQFRAHRPLQTSLYPTEIANRPNLGLLQREKVIDKLDPLTRLPKGWLPPPRQAWDFIEPGFNVLGRRRNDPEALHMLRQLVGSAPRNPVDLYRGLGSAPTIEGGRIAEKLASWTEDADFARRMAMGNTPPGVTPTLLRVPAGTARALPLEVYTQYAGEEEYLMNLLGTRRGQPYMRRTFDTLVDEQFDRPDLLDMSPRVKATLRDINYYREPFEAQHLSNVLPPNRYGGVRILDVEPDVPWWE